MDLIQVQHVGIYAWYGLKFYLTQLVKSERAFSWYFSKEHLVQVMSLFDGLDFNLLLRKYFAKNHEIPQLAASSKDSTFIQIIF